MNASALAIIKSLARLLHHYKQVGSLFREFNSPSYNPEQASLKSKVDQFVDYLYLFFVLRVLPTNYHLFQFDAMPRDRFKEYMDEPSSPFFRHKMYTHLWDDAYSCLVNDKYLFHCMCRHHFLPVPTLYGVLRKGIYVAADGEWPAIGEQDGKQAVLKPVRGTQGKGIHFVGLKEVAEWCIGADDKSPPDGLHKELLGADYVVQERIRQHASFDAINPHSLNTIRIITLLNTKNKAEILAAMVRTSRNESPIDNFSTGGIVVGIDVDTGHLRPEGFMKTPHGTTVTFHPVTGTRFSDVQVPHWEELKKVAARAQEVFHQLKAIGWDFAITQDGPVLIEGNIEWGTAGIQAATGGLLRAENRQLFAGHGLCFYK